MANEMIDLSQFAEYMTDLLEKEMQNAEETLDEVLSKRALQLKGKLQELSPKKSGDYAKGWRIKTAQRNHEKVKVLYNAEKPWLTFILEYGTGSAKARPHIRPALAEAMDDIIDELADRL